MDKMPTIAVLSDGSKAWENEFEKFSATVYMPKCDLYTDIINYGFRTPYLLIFGEKKYSFEEAQQFADENGLSCIAKEYGGSVVFIYPTNEGGWEKAPADLFASIISNTKISHTDNYEAVHHGCNAHPSRR